MATRLAKLTAQLKQDPGLPVAKPTTSYWQIPPREAVAHAQSPRLPTEADVVVIGSGITGCSVVKHLLEHDKNVRIVMLEARTITSGATGRNGGHAKAVPELSYASLAADFGHHSAEEIVRFTLENVEELLSLRSTLDPDLEHESELRNVESINIYTNETLLASARKDYEKFGVAIPDLKHRSRYIGPEDLNKSWGVANAAGGFVAPAGAAWPYRLVSGLLASLLKTHKGRFSIEAQTPAVRIEFSPDDNRYVIHTPRGALRTTKIVHATNGHAAHLLPGLRGPLFPVRGQMTAQKPSEEFGVQGDCRSWSITYGTGFDYITQSGESGEIFAGGALIVSDIFTEVGNPRDDQNGILMQAHLGGIMDATFGHRVCDGVKAAWTGIMGFTTDGVPLVGRLPQVATLRGGNQEWIAAGYNGYGMANAWLSGKHIAGRLLDSPDVQKIPSAYVISDERLAGMKAEQGAQYWLSAGGRD